ncbi:hypothetical protein NHQ30_000104 [Ciborinia camelliae]|nr:hypothetical protein NHQ30_000104 [Ciborinia camelliae]
MNVEDARYGATTLIQHSNIGQVIKSISSSPENAAHSLEAAPLNSVRSGRASGVEHWKNNRAFTRALKRLVGIISQENESVWYSAMSCFAPDRNQI